MKSKIQYIARSFRPHAEALACRRPDTLIRCAHVILMSVVAALLLSVTACKNSELWDDLPGPITHFINQYYPFSQLNSVTHNATTYHVRITDGPGLTFSATGDNPWEAIEGYGLPLPQVLLFDQLPPKMYMYLQETEQLNSVFGIARDEATYTATLLENTLKYTISTEEMTLI